MTIRTFPARGPRRHELLCETIKRIEAHKLPIAEVVEACEAALPDATGEEMAAALQAVAEAQLREAEAMQQYLEQRRTTQ